MTTSGFFHGYLPEQAAPLAWSATAGKRRLRPGTEYDTLFPRADMQNTQVKRGAKLEDTLRLIPQVVRHYQNDTTKLAESVRGGTLEETLSKLWHFCYEHINYERDREGTEELRRPARSWADRASGVDCDCYSIFLSSTLLNLGIPHSYRITKYGGRPQFQHIYVIVPDPSRRGSRKYWVLDPVLNQFDTEKPFSEHKDIPLNMNLEILSGFGEDMPLLGLEGEPELEMLLGLSAEPNDQELLRHLKATRSLVQRNPQAVSQTVHPQNLLEMLDYAIQMWHTPQRQAALDKLAQVEVSLEQRRQSLSGGSAATLEEYMDGLYGTTEDDALAGWLGGEDDELLGRRRGFFRRVGRAIGRGVKSAGKAIGKAAKAVGKAVMRFNPLTVAIRNGLLLALRMNVGKMGSKLKYGYLTEEQARAKGFDMAEWQKLVKTREKWEGRFERMGGKKGNFKAAILKGKAGGLDGTLGELAEPIAELGETYGADGQWQLGVAPAAGVGAAAPIIKAIIASLKTVSFKKLIGKQALKLVTNKLMNSGGGDGGGDAAEAQPAGDDSWMMEEADDAAASEAEAAFAEEPPQEAAIPTDESAPPDAMEEAPQEQPEESPVAGWLAGRMPEPLETDELGAELGFAFFRRLKDKVKGLLQKPAGGAGGGGIFSRLRARRLQGSGSPIRQWATGTRPAVRPQGQRRPFRLPTPQAAALAPTVPVVPITQPSIQPYADPMSTNLPAVIPAATTTPVATGPANAPRRNLFQRLGDWFRDPKISTASKVAMGAGAVLATGALVVGAQSLLGVEDGLSGLFNKKKSRRNRTQNLNGTHNHGGKQGRKKNAGKGGKKKHKNRSKPYHGKGYIPTVKLK